MSAQEQNEQQRMIDETKAYLTSQTHWFGRTVHKLAELTGQPDGVALSLLLCILTSAFLFSQPPKPQLMSEISICCYYVYRCFFVLLFETDVERHKWLFCSVLLAALDGVVRQIFAFIFRRIENLYIMLNTYQTKFIYMMMYDIVTANTQDWVFEGWSIYWPAKTAGAFALMLPPINLAGKWYQTYLQPLSRLMKGQADAEVLRQADPMLLSRLGLDPQHPDQWTPAQINLANVVMQEVAETIFGRKPNSVVSLNLPVPPQTTEPQLPPAVQSTTPSTTPAE